MILDKRAHQILDAIVHDPYITGVELEYQFKLTRKQLSYAIQKVNSFLESNNLEPIKRFKTGKFSVDKLVIEKFRHSEKKIKTKRYIYSEEERINLVIFYLLTSNKQLSLFHLSSNLTVSQNTIISTMKKVQISIETYNLQINYNRGDGYHIIGSEVNKRYLLLDIIRKIISIPTMEQIIFKNNGITVKNLEQVAYIFSEIESKLKVLFTDEQLQELIYFISFILQRIKTGRTIKKLPQNYSEAVNSSHFKFLQKLVEKFGIQDKNEQIFLIVLIQSSNIQTISDKYFHLDSVLFESSIAVVNNFEQISCISFKEKDELIERIYQHWKPAYYRIRYHISNINSVYDIVLQEFGHLHEIIHRAISPFEKLLHCKIPDEEVAFITVLFGGWLTREGMVNQIKTKKIAIVVCENSATISTYLYLTLQVLFPELHFSAKMSKREFEKYNRYYDIVFSTSYLNTDKIIFVINPSLNNFHKNSFRNQVIATLQGIDPSIIKVEEILSIIEKHTSINDKKNLQKVLTKYLYNEESQIEQFSKNTQLTTPSLSELMTLDHINIISNAKINWNKAIELAAEPLLKQKSIESYYIEKMIKKIEQDQPYIMLVDGLIIAHAGVDDGVNQVCMALLKLPEYIDIYGYMKADIIIILATNNRQKHLKALAQLNDFLEFHDGANKIRTACTIDEIYSLFIPYQ